MKIASPIGKIYAIKHPFFSGMLKHLLYFINFYNIAVLANKNIYPLFGFPLTVGGTVQYGKRIGTCRSFAQ